MTDSDNSSKYLMQKVIITALTIIIALVGTIWAITWQSTDNIAKENKEQIVSIKILMAEQQKQYEYLKERLDQIYIEVKK